MADESDVVNAFKSVLTQALYPAGVPGSGISPLIGSKISLMGGWPTPADVDSAMANGLSLISIFPRGEEKVTSRLNQASLPGSLQPTGTTLVATSSSVTFGGTPRVGDLVAIVATQTPGYALLDYTAVLDFCTLIDVIDQPSSIYSYAINSNDTPTSIATALAALIPRATSSGPVLEAPVVESASVFGSWNVIRETSRQEKLFQITVWAPKYDKRDAIAKAIRPVLDLAYRITLPDGTVTTTRYCWWLQALCLSAGENPADWPD